MSDNPLVAFLSTYGASASSDSLVDEKVRDAVRKFNVSPIRAPAPAMDSLVDNFVGKTNPKTVILTGTAGDGKTYHIRNLFLDHLGGTDAEWTKSGRDILSLKLPSGKVLRIIADLSGLKPSDKAAELGKIADSIKNANADTVYLIAANDGQLLTFWNDACAAAEGTALWSEYEDIRIATTHMLQRDQTEGEHGYHLTIHNLSRSTTEGTVRDIFNGVVHHEGWETGCDNCAQKNSGCPIRLNRDLILNDNSPMRMRLMEIIKVASMNDQHVSIRYILSLAANILLGDCKKADRPHLNCRIARRRSAKAEYIHTSPYQNAMGLNFPERERLNNPVYAMFSMAGIGYETNNLLDDFLIDETFPDLKLKLEQEDPTYGSVLFEPHRSSYLKGTNGKTVSEFEAALAEQRRRLFFLLPSTSKTDGMSAWNLTVYQHAGEYLEFSEALENDETEKIERIARKLVKGINRTLTGLMADNGDKLYLAHSIGRLDGAPGRVIFGSEPELSDSALCQLRIHIDPSTKRPKMQTGFFFADFNKACPHTLDLRPLLFEYLLRVSDGSLPSSFSRQCQQEIRHFALVSSAFMEKHKSGKKVEIHTIAVSGDGNITKRRIGG